ncbi:MurR/RpiR family transcriptional regulator [Devosia sp.]|uniref:MurR/RpiR family transcriptional regulator n=1 Tax=Devosia sp. TaxID=1871048 RepID=UPI002F07DD06
MSIRNRILEILDDLPAAERRLADVVLGHLDTIALYTANELAERARVSGATAVRFFRRLGFASFNDFRLEGRGQIEDGAPLERLNAGSLSDDMSRFVAGDARNIAATFDALPPGQVDSFVAQALAARHVWVIGFRNGQILAAYAHSLLQQLRSDVRQLVGTQPHVSEVMAEIETGDLAIVMDFRRRSVLLPKVVSHLRSEAVVVAFLTDGLEPPLTRQGDIAFTVQTSGAGLFDSHAATLSLINYLANRLARAAEGAVARKLDRIEAIHRSFRDLRSE